MWEKEISTVVEKLSSAQYAVATTGAGVSAESGIATFRDEGGIWDTLDIEEMGTPESFIQTVEREADRLIPYFRELLQSFLVAEANGGHHALAALEQMGLLKSLITQNGDNLHYEAGNRNILELHGNFFRMRCISCGAFKEEERKELLTGTIKKIDSLYDYDMQSLLSLVPRCPSCLSIMRPDVVMFSEAVQHMEEAFTEARNADLLLVLGTSGMVYPASYLPVEAKKGGAFVVVINPQENSFTEQCDLYLPLKTGEALPRIVESLKARH